MASKILVGKYKHVKVCLEPLFLDLSRHEAWTQPDSSLIAHLQSRSPLLFHAKSIHVQRCASSAVVSTIFINFHREAGKLNCPPMALSRDHWG